MGKISGTLNEESRILIYDLQTNTVVIDEVNSAGSYEYLGLTSYDKWVSAMNTATGESLSYGKVTPAGEPPVEITYSILTADDDGGYYDGAWRAGATRLSIDDGSSDIIYMRFDNITIPKDSSIEVAYLELRSAYGNQGTVRELDLQIRVQAADDPIAPTDPTSLINIRNNSLTATIVNWNDIPFGYTGSPTYNTPSIISLIQETVDRAGWASGNAIQLLLCYGSADGSAGPRYFSAYENTSYPEPKLYIRFQAP
ncbi:MAG: hypothetical protein DRQ47_09405 [Gammaproteobacteria bacterium]|nr:MAG: hypothetical protein DRQ47_09405 [Gammaproteobacteria bacterium]